MSLHPSRLWAPGGNNGSTGFWGRAASGEFPSSQCSHSPSAGTLTSSPPASQGLATPTFSLQWHLSLGLCRAGCSRKRWGFTSSLKSPHARYTRVHGSQDPRCLAPSGSTVHLLSLCPGPARTGAQGCRVVRVRDAAWASSLSLWQFPAGSGGLSCASLEGGARRLQVGVNAVPGARRLPWQQGASGSWRGHSCLGARGVTGPCGRRSYSRGLRPPLPALGHLGVSRKRQRSQPVVMATQAGRLWVDD